MKKKTLFIIVLFTTYMFVATCFSGFSTALAKEAQTNKVKVKNPVNPASAIIKKKPVIGDAGSSEVYDPGVDLVVSKVVMTKGVFGSDPATRIQIIPYIKNMWQGKTSKRIKVWFDGLSMAIWLEGGLNRYEEKSAGAIYLPDISGTGAYNFYVEVDNNNAIPENNEGNNRCGNIRFAYDETSKIYRCPIAGPHNRLE
jgi:hypothetical protein